MNITILIKVFLTSWIISILTLIIFGIIGFNIEKLSHKASVNAERDLVEKYDKLSEKYYTVAGFAFYISLILIALILILVIWR